MPDIEKQKQEFLTLCSENIHREGLEDLLTWLQKSDFFTARRKFAVKIGFIFVRKLRRSHRRLGKRGRGKKSDGDQRANADHKGSSFFHNVNLLAVKESNR